MPSPIAQLRNETPRVTPKSFEITSFVGNVLEALGADFGSKSKESSDNAWFNDRPALFIQNAAINTPPASVEEALKKHDNLSRDNTPELRQAFQEILAAQVNELHQGQPPSAEAVGVLVKIGNNLGGEGQILMQTAYSKIEEARRDPFQSQTRGEELKAA